MTNESPLTGKYSELILAGGVVGILIIMVMPLPTVMLDILLSFSITFSVIILLVSMYMMQALEFSVFPSLLLIVTLYRLSLNIASTRVILLHGNEGTGAAGQVIKSFGDFVVGGNYVVGMVVFLILVIINFVVITKGSVRTSEVAARFTLDAIPGKQMGIDADLNAGMINEKEAQSRRKQLEQEADFYGSMDGAIRFVRGDAIAGIIITGVNVLGGFFIGVLQQGMDLSQAAEVYTTLTIGDGLVSQLPALIISTAAGIVVTRASSDKSLGKDIASQLLFHPKAFAIASGVLFFFGMVPGLPHFAFFVLAIAVGTIAYFTFESQKAAEVEKIKKIEEEKPPVQERVESILPLDVVELEVGYELIPLVDASRDGELLNRIKSIRRQFALEMGIIVPPVHIRDNLQLKPNEYSILVKGTEVTKGELMMGNFLAMNPGAEADDIGGIPTKEPTFGLPAVWITESEKGKAQMAGYTVVDNSTVVTTHIKEIIKNYAHDLLGRQETQALLDNVKETHPKAVEDIVPNLLSLAQIQTILQNLLKKQVSIRDILTILEVLGKFAPTTKDTELLTEYVRQALARPISSQYQTAEGEIPVITVDKKVEDILTSSIQRTEFGTYVSIEPDMATNLLNKIKDALEKISPMEIQPIILSSQNIRVHLKKLTERFMPNLVCLSHNEITPKAKIKSLGVITL
ncbi:MAG: flagellar biosynthesis protein FlhA [Gammaproteobacteria bacterium]|nr:flagellar biosynthesis protein FlhA [Gammaproteobacteria bacterium]